MKAAVDTRELETKVKDMYRHVAEQPQGEYHLELGRPLAIRLGYTTDILDRVPDVACESFAGVGHFFDLAELSAGERKLLMARRTHLVTLGDDRRQGGAAQHAAAACDEEPHANRCSGRAGLSREQTPQLARPQRQEPRGSDPR